MPHAELLERTYLQTPEQWTRFLSAFTHELRTPIASLRMLADLLAAAPQDHLGDPEKRYAENIQEVVQDIQLLVSEVADLGRVLTGRAQIRAEEIALPQLVEKVEEAVRPRAWERGIVLTHFLDPALPQGFYTDPDRFRQALSLVLGAAVSQARSEVDCRIEAQAGHLGGLRVVISSDGPPHPETALATLFEPYEEGAWIGRQRGGRSLALPLANELARALGGRLSAGNRGGRPAFELALPASGSEE
jgi:signal transduction histidine kinase